MNDTSLSEKPLENDGNINHKISNTINESDDSLNNEVPADIGNDESVESSESRFQEFFSETVEADKPKITETLKVFLQLREVDEELFEIEEEKGDLPENIDSIKSKLESLNSKLKEKKDEQANAEKEKAKLEADNSAYEERINKYDEQKYNVRTNSEYDEIIKTIEGLFEEVSKNESRIKEIENNSGAMSSEIALHESKFDELKSELDEKQTLLNELNEQYKQEDIVLKERRDKLTVMLDSYSSTLYERINKMHKGEATAIVRKSNCSGCYNSIPPQRVIEIKAAEKIYTCQSCGRILISDELNVS